MFFILAIDLSDIFIIFVDYSANIEELDVLVESDKTLILKLKIMWLFIHGSVCLQTQYMPKSYQIVENVYQTALLLLFNENKVLTYKEISRNNKAQ